MIGDIYFGIACIIGSVAVLILGYKINNRYLKNDRPGIGAIDMLFHWRGLLLILLVGIFYILWFGLVFTLFFSGIVSII